MGAMIENIAGYEIKAKVLGVVDDYEIVADDDNILFVSGDDAVINYGQCAIGESDKGRYYAASYSYYKGLYQKQQKMQVKSNRNMCIDLRKKWKQKLQQKKCGRKRVELYLDKKLFRSENLAHTVSKDMVFSNEAGFDYFKYAKS